MFQLRKIKAEKTGSLESNFHFPALRELGFSQLLLNGVGGEMKGAAGIWTIKAGNILERDGRQRRLVQYFSNLFDHAPPSLCL